MKRKGIAYALLGAGTFAIGGIVLWDLNLLGILIRDAFGWGGLILAILAVSGAIAGAGLFVGAWDE